MSWKRFVFLQLHVWIFGTHRTADKTHDMDKELAWWDTVKTDANHWTLQCLTCLRFRRRPTKQDQVAVKPTRLHPWQEVMIGCEGSSQPPDEDGNTYILTYCCLCHGALLEPMKNLSAPEVRRAFTRCVFHSGCIPSLLRSDRGPEFRSLLMKKFIALVGMRHRFGAPWTPVAQAGVERVHQ